MRSEIVGPSAQCVEVCHPAHLRWLSMWSDCDATRRQPCFSTLRTSHHCMRRARAYLNTPDFFIFSLKLRAWCCFQVLVEVELACSLIRRSRVEARAAILSRVLMNWHVLPHADDASLARYARGLGCAYFSSRRALLLMKIGHCCEFLARNRMSAHGARPQPLICALPKIHDGAAIMIALLMTLRNQQGSRNKFQTCIFLCYFRGQCLMAMPE